MATAHPLNKPSGQPQLPHKPGSLAVHPGQAFPCFHLPELLLVGHTQGSGAARAEFEQEQGVLPRGGSALPATAPGLARSIWQPRAPWDERKTRAKGHGGLPNLTSCRGDRHCWQLGDEGDLYIPINPDLWWICCCPEKPPQKNNYFSVAAAPPFFPLFLPVQ